MEIRGWDPILHGCGGTLTLARGELSPRSGSMSPSGGTLALSRGAARAAHWLHEAQPITNQQMGWGFHTVRGDIDPGDLRFRLRGVHVVGRWEDL